MESDSTRAKFIPQLADVIGTSLDKGDELDALAKLEPKKQAEVIEKVKSGKKVSAKAEVKKANREAKERAHHRTGSALVPVGSLFLACAGD